MSYTDFLSILYPHLVRLGLIFYYYHMLLIVAGLQVCCLAYHHLCGLSSYCKVSLLYGKSTLGDVQTLEPFFHHYKDLQIDIFHLL